MIKNLDVQGPVIYIAVNSLYILMQNEIGIMAAATIIKPDVLEKKFNSMLEEAVDDYKAFLSAAYEDDIFKISTLINFKELFDVCLDIKKKEKVEVESGLAGFEQPNATAAVTSEMVEKPSKQQRRK